MSDWEIRAVPSGSALEADGRLLRGYAVVFNSRSLTMNTSAGKFIEIMSPEAVDRTLSEGIDVRALVDHAPGKVIGRRSAGTLRLEKDRTGLRAVIEPDPEVSYAKDIIRSVTRGDITGMSFKFATLADDWDFRSSPPIRTVYDTRISEVSIVSFPSYPDAEVAMRSMQDFRASHGSQVWKRNADRLKFMR